MQTGEDSRTKDPNGGDLTPIGEKQVPEFKIPKSTCDKSTKISSLDQWKTNAKDGSQNGAQTHKPWKKQCSGPHTGHVTVCLPDMYGIHADQNSEP